MEPKEKAEELVKKYLPKYENALGFSIKEFINAKQYALIAVDEIILEREVIYASIGISPGTFWHQVKEEIEKL